MWPWAHAALGYLLYATLLGFAPSHSSTPDDGAVLVLGVGTQLPDLVDKPLAWYLHVLPYGRTLMHSLLLGGVAVALLAFALRRRDRAELGVALALGYYSHLLGDSYQLVLTGQWDDLAFLVWPLLPIPGVDAEVEGLFAHLANVEGSPFFLFGLALTAVAFALWLRQGTPGLGTLRGWLASVSRSG